MSRAAHCLLLVLAAEALVGGILAAQRMNRLAPPEADWELLDSATAADLRAASRCTSGEDWRSLGELFMAAGCFDESERCHRIACDLDPRDATYARQWGFALERLGMLDEASAQYRRAMDLRPQEADACRYLIARNLLRAEKHAEALALFEEGKALAANRYELARLHLRDAKFAEAADLHRGVAEERPGALQVELLGYRLELERGDARQAARYADRARQATAKLPNPFDEEAARLIEVTQRLGPNWHWKEGRALIEARRLDEAEAMLREAGKTYRSNAVNELLGEVALAKGRPNEAITLFEEFQTRNGSSARMHARIGDAWHAAKDPAKARASWLHAAQLEAGADLKDMHHKLAVSFRAAADQAAADRHLARGHYHVGRELLKFGYADKSVAYFEGAVRTDRKFTQAWFYLGEAQRLSGERDDAVGSYRKCLALDPDHGRALAALALLEADKKE